MKSIGLILMIALLAMSCKKEQPELTPVNQDCSCANEVSADFEILELEAALGFDPEGTDSDTVFIGANVIFRAKEEGAEYTWYIGSEVLNTQEVGRNFPVTFADQEITVSLVVRKQANTICFPNDDGYDSISRTFYVQNYTASDLTSTFDNGVTLMEGTYRMIGPGVADSFDITIDYIDRNPPPQPIEQIDVINFDNQGTTIMIPRNSPQRKTYHGLWIEEQGTANKCLGGKFINTLGEGAFFHYTYCEQINGEYVYIERELKGRKL